jgi:hypothetical protein
VLRRGKTAADYEDSIVVNPGDNREAAKAMDRWLDRAGIESLFRSIRKGSRLQPERLSPDYVARIVKARALAIA